MARIMALDSGTTSVRALIFDENGKVLSSVADEVYRTALAQALDTGNRYVTSSDIDILLEFINGRWLIRADENLLSALSGGAADA